MKKTLLVIIIVFSFFGTDFAQQWRNFVPNYNRLTSDSNFFIKKEDTLVKKVNRHGLFAELLGGGYVYSVGYQYDIVIKSTYELQFSIGFSSWYHNKPDFSFGFPISFNNRFKFLKFNGIDIGFTFSEFINTWAIKDQEKYFDCPYGDCRPKISVFFSLYLGWVFRIKQFSIMPRFYVFPYFNNPYNNRIAVPWFGLRLSYTFKSSKK